MQCWLDSPGQVGGGDLSVLSTCLGPRGETLGLVFLFLSCCINTHNVRGLGASCPPLIERMTTSRICSLWEECSKVSSTPEKFGHRFPVTPEMDLFAALCAREGRCLVRVDLDWCPVFG